MSFPKYFDCYVYSCAERFEKLHKRIQLLSLVEKDYSVDVKDVLLLFSSYFWTTFLFEYLSNKFCLILFVCSNNDNLHEYQTMRNRRNIKYILGNINM